MDRYKKKWPEIEIKFKCMAANKNTIEELKIKGISGIKEIGKNKIGDGLLMIDFEKFQHIMLTKDI